MRGWIVWPLIKPGDSVLHFGGSTYQEILAAEARMVAMFGRGSEAQRAGSALLRQDAWCAVQRDHTHELGAIVGACFGALLGWTE